MKQQVTKKIIVALLAVGILLILFIPTRQQSQLDAVCRVEGKVCYAIAINARDTLYLSLNNDTLQTASIHNDLSNETHYQSGAFVSNCGHIVTSDALMLNHEDTLSNEQLHQRLVQLDSLLTHRLKVEKGEQAELDDYALGHTVVDDGYNEVMAYRVKVTQQVEQTSATLKRIQQALNTPHLKAELLPTLSVSNAHLSPQRAKVEVRHKGLLLLQLETQQLPQGCSRYSVYRWGVRAMNRRLFAYNDPGSRCLLLNPTISKGNDSLFTATEGGAWVNRSGHICGIQRNGVRISSFRVAQLMQKAHIWPVWWWKNLVAWCKSFKTSDAHPQPQPMQRPDLKGLHCKRFALNDSVSYAGLVSHQQIEGRPMRQGFGTLTYSNGKVYTGYWYNDTLKTGTCSSPKGTYEGEFNARGQFHGKGIYYAQNGETYSGEWNLGRRSGHGFSSQSRHMVRCGSWHNGRFQGERMVYTSDRIYGIDISRHQHEKGRGRRMKKYSIDWDRLRIYSLGNGRRVQGAINYPVSFIYIKATEGRTMYNKYYPNDLRQARKRGISVGSYHFFSTTSTGAQQADHFLRMAWIAPNDLPPVLDIEPSEAQIRNMGGDKALFKQVLTWLHRVEHKHGKRPVLYVSQMFVNNHLKNAPAELRNYDVWIARYGEFKPYVKLLHWQLTPYGRVSGIFGEVDINVFNGTKADFEKYINNTRKIGH